MTALEATTPGPLVHDVSFALSAGRTVALVGESGSGKTLTALALIGLLPPGVHRTSGHIAFEGVAREPCTDHEWSKLRGRRIGFVFQDPSRAVSPVHRIGDQIVDVLRTHRLSNGADARRRALALLHDVGLSSPEAIALAYPQALSGGMLQRAMIAIALAGEPDILLADEPTSALDVTVQAQVLSLLRDLQTRRGLALLLITHDLGLVAHMADDVLVMFAGRIVERASVQRLFERPAHPYTRELLLAAARRTGVTRVAEARAARSDRSASDSCVFEPRCDVRLARCQTHQPSEFAIDGAHTVRCFAVTPDAHP